MELREALVRCRSQIDLAFGQGWGYARPNPDGSGRFFVIVLAVTFKRSDDSCVE
jgi:hypothetical protein